MADSRCSRGSGDGGSARDLRFRYVFCNCKKMASLRMVTNQTKPTRGKLYFICESKECCFFKWCEPIHEVEGCSSSTSVGGSDFEGLALNLSEVKDKIDFEGLALNFSEIKDKIEKLVNVVSYCLWFVVVVTIVCVFK